MSTYEDDDNEFDEFADEYDEDPRARRRKRSDGPKALRDALDKEKARSKELAEKLAKVESGLAKRTIADVLSSKGANPKLARHVARDLEGDEITPEAVGKWLEEEGEIFGFKPQEEDDGGASEAHDTQRAARAASGSAPTPDDDALANIAGASSPEELQAAMAAAGIR